MNRGVVFLVRLVRRENGASMVEYGLLIALIAVASMVALSTVGVEVGIVFAEAALAIDEPNETETPPEESPPDEEENPPDNTRWGYLRSLMARLAARGGAGL